MTIEPIVISALSNDPANVRRHSQRNLEAIKASLRRFGQQIPLVVDANNIVRVGNARLEAMRQLGWEQAQIIRTNLTGADLVAYAVADNRTGDPELGSTFDNSALADVLAALQSEDAQLVEAAGYSPAELAKLIGETNGAGVPNDPATQWQGMPECESEDQTAFASIKVNFASAADREAFAKLVGQTVSENTRSIWYPPAPIGTYADKRIVDAP